MKRFNLIPNEESQPQLGRLKKQKIQNRKAPAPKQQGGKKDEG